MRFAATNTSCLLRLIALVAIISLISIGSAHSQEDAEATVNANGEVNTEAVSENDNAEPEGASKPEEKKEPVEEEAEPEYLKGDPGTWGSYYDPQQEFCGKYDCYRIFGYDYESFGREHPSTKEITKRYRRYVLC
jgi:hypothetical protein